MRERTHETLGARRLALLVIAPFFFGYFLSYLFRAVNAVVATDLVAELSLSASALGLVTAAYLIGFASFQIPLGMLLDRFGPRRVQAALFLIAALGALLFAAGRDALSLALARGLIGIGCAGGLMAGFKAVADFSPPERRALYNSFIMAAGGLGLLFAATPARMAADALGWRGLFIGLAALSVIAAAAIFLAVPERREKGHAESLVALLKGMRTVFASPAFWRVAPLAALTSGSQIAVQTLWAGPWFTDVAGMDAAGASRMLSLMAAGFFAGTLLNGVVADRLGARGVPLDRVMLGFALLFMAAQAVAVSGYTGPGMALAWFLMPLTGQTGILAYPLLAAHFGARLAGRSNSALNLGVFLAAFAGQWLVGLMIDLTGHAVRPYPAEGFSLGFGMLLLVQALALAWYLIAPRGSRE